uniref:hypothetical protein n=1 Tax=Salmonella sp. s51228 TaxID=3159652 RepID=UPI00397EA082
TLNTTANLAIIAENCVGNSTQDTAVIPAIQGVSFINVTAANITDNVELEFNLEFVADSILAVNYTVYTITNFTNGTTDMRAISTSVLNSNVMSSQAIPLMPYLLSNNLTTLIREVENVSIMVTVNSQCGQLLTISSDVFPVDISAAPTTTPTISRTDLSATYSVLLLLLSVFIILMT